LSSQFKIQKRNEKHYNSTGSANKHLRLAPVGIKTYPAIDRSHFFNIELTCVVFVAFCMFFSHVEIRFLYFSLQMALPTLRFLFGETVEKQDI